jgi:choline dehydrogenase-like flavoprotein
MMSDIRDYPDGSGLAADVIVVGSGIAGSEVATTLASKGLDVLVLESGRAAFDRDIQALNAIEFLGKPHRRLDPEAPYQTYLEPELRGVSRVRQLGGTSNVWTGKWKPFEASDFEDRPCVADSPWPLRRADLDPYYRSAAQSFGLGDFAAEARRPEVVAMRERAARAGLKTSSFYWEEVPTRTAVRFADEFATSAKLRMVTGATVTDLALDDAGRRVRTVTCRSIDGRMLRASARQVVLATGALETPRLLLASNGQRPNGIGNDHDLVGRYYTDHPKHHSGALAPGPFVRAFASELQYGPKPRFCVSFALSNATQREYGLLEHSVYLKPLYAGRARRLTELMKGRLAVRDGKGHVAAYRVLLVVEQVPTRDSRVTLASERDALGVPKLQLDWRVTARDQVSLGETVRLLADRFAAAGIGTFEFGDAPPQLEIMTDAAHQMGTTRMARRPEEGVVDADCRVFGTENLHVAGSAVFPTGPTYSPTFTILALARRLAEHLATAEVSRDAAVLA